LSIKDNPRRKKQISEPKKHTAMQTNLNPLFIDQLRSFAHLITPEPQTKNQFLQTIKSTYSLENPKTKLFYLAAEKSIFETIKLNTTRSAILFNQ
jgi:hypothetical protein